ncbi:hypothetical protein WJX72_007713 [[Myrmecia] bisecta]|uniref:Glutamine amidotransferase type-2 domain-containing protein n=1 Tax=[Myrmecia] bisecta TaxID=41462 RepID=A0AAW1PP29_9CHLO
MQGSFYAVVCRQASVSWLFPSVVQIDQKFLRNPGSGCSNVDLLKGRAPSQSYILAGGGVVVSEADAGVNGYAASQQPRVAFAKDVVAVFCGYLSNLEDLLDRHRLHSLRQWCSKDSSADQTSLAAHVLHHLYFQYAPANLMVLLSELQGEFTFMLYDAHRKRAFAARSPSPYQPLYQATDKDGCLHVTNEPPSTNQAPQAHDVPHDAWREVPPGHCITGRNFNLQQFALTPGQLTERRSIELLEDSSPPLNGSSSWTLSMPSSKDAADTAQEDSSLSRRSVELDLDDEAFLASMGEFAPRPAYGTSKARGVLV